MCVLRCGATIAVAFVIVGVAGDVIDENLFDSLISLIGREKILLLSDGYYEKFVEVCADAIERFIQFSRTFSLFYFKISRNF